MVEFIKLSSLFYVVALKIVSDVADHANESMRQGVCITLCNFV